MATSGGSGGAAESEAEIEEQAFSEANTAAVQAAAKGKSTTTVAPLNPTTTISEPGEPTTPPPASSSGGGITLPPGITPVGAAGGGGLGTTGTTASNTQPPPTTTTTTTTTTTSGGGGGGDSTLLPTGLQSLSPTAVAAALDGYLDDDNFAIENFIADTGAPNTASDSWNFLVDQVENVFTDLENSMDDITSAGFGVDVAVSAAEVAAGVTADVGTVDVVFVAVGFLIAQQMAGWVITHVGEGLPDPSIFGWHPMGFVKGVITDLGNKLQTLSQDTIDSLAGLFMQPIRQLTGLFQRSTNAHANAQNQNARIVQDTVPTAKQDAITAAEEYTDQQLQAVDTAATQALIDLPPTTTLDEAKALVTESQQYDTLSWKFTGIGAAAMVQADEYAASLHDQTSADIAAAQAQAESAAQSAISSLQTQLVNRLSGDETSLQALASSVNVTIPNEIETATNNAVATENQQLTAATSTIEQQITAIQAQIGTLTTQVQNANQTIATAQSTITNLESQASVDENAIAQQQAIITAANTEIATSQTAISDLYTQLTSISSTLAPIQATQQLQTSQISSITTDLDVALPTLLATIAATLNSVKTEVDTCSVQTCDPTSPNYLKNALLALLALLTDAAEIGFVAEAVKDPVGTANALAPLLDSIGGAGIDALDALLSL